MCFFKQDFWLRLSFRHILTTDFTRDYYCYTNCFSKCAEKYFENYNG